MSSAPQAGVQPVDLAQNLLQSNPSADALVRQLAQMQVQNQQVNYQQQVCPPPPCPLLTLCSVDRTSCHSVFAGEQVV